MAKVEIVEDASIAAAAGVAESNSDMTPRITEITSYSDNEEDIVEEDDFDINESLTDRVLALRDAIPPQLRDNIASSALYIGDLTRSVARFGGRSLWVITSSSLLLGIPLSLCILSEQQLTEMSKSVGMDTNVLS